MAGLAWLLATCQVHADVSFATNSSEYVAAPGGLVEVPVYLEFSGTDVAALLSEQGLYGTGVRMRVLHSLPASTPAAVATNADILPNVAEFDDPFGAIASVGDGYAALLVTVDPFSTDGDLGAVGSMVGSVRRVSLGVFRYTASSSAGEVTTIHIGDYSGATSDTITWLNFLVLDPSIKSATFSIRTSELDCLADYTGDGAVDILDFLDFLEDFSLCNQLNAPCGSLGNPDVNGDTSIDILDFLDFLQSFGEGC